MNLCNVFIVCITAHLDIYHDHVFPAQCSFSDLTIDETVMRTNVMVPCSILQYVVSICIIKSDLDVYGLYPNQMSLFPCWLSGQKCLIYFLGMNDVIVHYVLHR